MPIPDWKISKILAIDSKNPNNRRIENNDFFIIHPKGLIPNLWGFIFIRIKSNADQRWKSSFQIKLEEIQKKQIFEG